MRKRLQTALALCLLLAIAYVFVLPAFDIDPTALRASRHAISLFLAIAAAGSMLTIFRPAALLRLYQSFPAPQSGPNLIDLTCTRLC
jgi:hypothetical protein